MLTMRDQDQVVQDLKKENFDLKLRLYMQTRNTESNEGKVSEYEQQLGAILNRFEEQQKVFEQQSRELAEAKHKEKLLLKRQRNLENECKARDEKIQNLSMSLHKLSTSMTNINSERHFTPARNTRSMYFPHSDDDEDDEEDDSRDGYHSENTSHSPAHVSRVAPLRRGHGKETLMYHDEMRLMDHLDRPGRNSLESSSSDPTSRLTNNYYNTTVNHPSNNNNNNNRNDGCDNIGVVRPNNARTVVDVDFPEKPQGRSTPVDEEQTPNDKKKKRKSLMNFFGLCSGKSSERSTTRDSMYEKRPSQPTRVTVQTFNTTSQ